MTLKKIILFIVSLLIVTETDYVNLSITAEATPLIASVVIPKIENTIESKEVKDEVEYKLNDIHTATWYDLTGRKTASGERFHRDSLTAAYNYSGLGSYLKVTNIKNDKFVVVKVTDRMGYQGRNHIDLSKGAFDSIGELSSGRIKVIIEEIK